MKPRHASPPLPAGPPERALAAGTRLAEYDIEGVIAHGSVAVVYRAYDHVLKLRVALKEYLPEALVMRSGATQLVLREREHAPCFERGRQAFVHEARILAHCQHPALPRVVRMLHQHGTAYRVMRLCAGPTLLEHCRGRATARDATALRGWVDHLLGALAELHGLGLVHGAVSPAKILMVPGHGPVLMSSQAVRAALLSGSTRGLMAWLEPGFMPIEQREPASERPLGPWTDLYALAATLRYYIGGPPPAALPAHGSADAPADTPAGIASLGALWQRRFGGTAAACAWLEALDACLAEPGRQRPQSVAQLRALLQAHDAAPPSQPPPTTRPTHSPWALARGVGVGPEQFPMVAVPAAPVADLQHTLPFVAARAHQVAAAASAAPTPAVPPVPPVPPLPALPARLTGVRPPRPRWSPGAALMLALTLSLAAGAWLHSRDGGAAPPPLLQAAGEAVPAAAPRHAVVPSTGLALFSAAPVLASASPAAVETGAAAASSGAAVVFAATVAPSLPEPPPPGAKPSPAPVAPPLPAAVRAPDSPGARCNARSGYARYQCLQTQCAKRGWAQHAQCRRLRQQQALS